MARSAEVRLLRTSVISTPEPTRTMSVAADVIRSPQLLIHSPAHTVPPRATNETIALDAESNPTTTRIAMTIRPIDLVDPGPRRRDLRNTVMPSHAAPATLPIAITKTKRRRPVPTVSPPIVARATVAPPGARELGSGVTPEPRRHDTPVRWVSV